MTSEQPKKPNVKVGVAGRPGKSFSEVLRAAEEQAGCSFTPLPKPDIHKTIHPEKLDI